MSWILELSWLWKGIGTVLLSVALCEGVAVLLCRGLKKRLGAKAAALVAAVAVVAAAAVLVCLSKTPALI